MRTLTLTILCFTLLNISYSAQGEKVNLNTEVEQALKESVTYFTEEVSTEGGYLWRYSEDLVKREGEGKANDTMAWVQPPGTPTVGGAFLDAYEATGDSTYLDAARDTAMALVKGQLESGGWDYRIYFNPEDRKKYAYRVDRKEDATRNTTTLDDNTTQAALSYLMRIDRTLDFEDDRIHEAATYTLKKLLEAQYPNGAWPQRFSGPPNPEDYPVKKANYPETWSRTHPDKDYKDYYTFNDNTIADTVGVMLEAAEIYEDEQYREAAKKAGDFILLAQMPEPQSAWAQQYNADMQPAWARRFEPPSITGGESQGAMQTLLTIYRETGDKKYLEPIPRALEYFENSRLPDGGLARFYELKTNKPLYFTKDYQLTYDDSDMPTHYGFKKGYWVPSLRKQYEETVQGAPEEKQAVKDLSQLETAARKILDRLDDRGRWVEDSRLKYHGDDDPTRRIISTGTFVKNVGILCDYLEAVKDQ